MPNRKYIYRLERPLIVHQMESKMEMGILPKGTRMHYNQGFAEGFDRYIIYVNVEGNKFLLEKTDKPDLIDPMTAFAGFPDEKDVISTEDLKRILMTMGVSKAALEDVIETYGAENETNRHDEPGRT